MRCSILCSSRPDFCLSVKIGPDGVEKAVLGTYINTINQQFLIQDNNIISLKTGHLLTNEDPLVFTPRTSDSKQIYHINSDGTISNANGLVLDIRAEKIVQDTDIIPFPKHGRFNQIWRVVSI
ncbi:hypothetical protein TVAG_001140 [Trichomonas vaginalis G3]|nr:Ricin B-like lectins family [Trichomonas vaginalis G3]EAX87672.1 hypothetical protein TVAG_001140 [Trichomonas vaginalis G3]KAI5538284.1 Ricin B-like lectins family [Trichomonas vaginalis G3]|eukprot:XP_001300602.1 hypothetical protein [Trichomonas vaginalis G3]